MKTLRTVNVLFLKDFLFVIILLGDYLYEIVVLNSNNINVSNNSNIEYPEDDFYEDEVVVFTAQSRPNDKDPNKLFWFATNVRLKE